MTAAAADFDDDGWTDIYVASDSTAAILYRNNHDGTFSDVALQSGTAFSENGMAQAGMGLAVGDYNADGRLDLFKTHFADDIPALYRSLGNGPVRGCGHGGGTGACRTATSSGAPACRTSTTTAGRISCTSPATCTRKSRRGFPSIPTRARSSCSATAAGRAFEDVTARSGPGVTTPRSSRGAAFGDFDNDGDIDVLVMNMNEPPALLRNDYAARATGSTSQLEGCASNRSAIGATVRVTAAGRTQAQAVLSQSSYYSVNDLRLHFGLGAFMFITSTSMSPSLSKSPKRRAATRPRSGHARSARGVTSSKRNPPRCERRRSGPCRDTRETGPRLPGRRCRSRTRRSGQPSLSRSGMPAPHSTYCSAPGSRDAVATSSNRPLPRE